MLLDEPLANLDYKLREELRDQLPALFAGRGAIVVYATSEPSEALMLGGHTATVAEGRVTQFGPTQECYRAPGRPHHRPGLLRPADQRRPGREARRRDRAPRPRALAGRRRRRRRSPTAPTPSALRPHFVTPARAAARTRCRSQGVVQITELSGSESVAHFAVGDTTWVAQSNGVHPYRVGETHDFYLDVAPRPLLRRRRPEGRLMARIGLKDLRHSYIAAPARARTTTR